MDVQQKYRVCWWDGERWQLTFYFNVCDYNEEQMLLAKHLLRQRTKKEYFISFAAPIAVEKVSAYHPELVAVGHA